MDAATLGSNSFSHPLSDFLQEHAGSSTSILDTKDGKVDTVKKIQKVWVCRFTIDPPLAGFYHPILNPGMSRRLQTIQTTSYRQGGVGFLHVFQLMLLGKKPVKAAS